MADLSLVTSNEVNVVESIEQMTLPAGEAITPGQVVRLDTSTGKFTKANATTVAEGRAYGIATGKKAIAAGEPMTAVRQGVLDGFDLSSFDYDAAIYLSITDGALTNVDPSAYGETIPVGRVIPGNNVTLGTANDKLLLVDL